MSDHIPDPGKMVSARDEAVERALMAAWCNPPTSSGMTDAEAFISALAAAGYVIEQDWQPIETAPRDGRWVQTYGPDTGISDGYQLDAWPCDEDGWNGKPTHWRPLPAPPAAAKETQA
jgi:hypothetical protein